MRLLTGTVPVNNSLLTGTVPVKRWTKTELLTSRSRAYYVRARLPPPHEKRKKEKKLAP